MPECIFSLIQLYVFFEENRMQWCISFFSTHLIVNLGNYIFLKAFNARMYILIGCWKSTEVDKVRFFYHAYAWSKQKVAVFTQ